VLCTMPGSSFRCLFSGDLIGAWEVPQLTAQIHSTVPSITGCLVFDSDVGHGTVAR
jgi:hypothetical protein